MPIPPGGFAGFAQMTPASRIALQGGMTRSRGPVRRRRKTSAKRTKRAKRASAKRSGRKLKFGSPAWQKKYKVGKYRK